MRVTSLVNAVRIEGPGLEIRTATIATKPVIRGRAHRTVHSRAVRDHRVGQQPDRRRPASWKRADQKPALPVGQKEKAREHRPMR